jgi:3-phytase
VVAEFRRQDRFLGEGLRPSDSRDADGRFPRQWLALLALCLAMLGAAQAAPHITPARVTTALPLDPDDPAIWVNPVDPARSLIVGTVKAPAPDGGLAVFGMDGQLHQILKGADRPNNVDVEYGLPLAGARTDIAVLTERLGRRLRAYAFAPDGSTPRDVSGDSLAHVLTGAPANEGAPMGIGLYRRPSDGAIFAIVAPKAGPKTGYLWQFRLEDDGTGHVGARFVRRFGDFSGSKEIEAVAVDDALGYVYYADEDTGIHKWLADPDRAGADRELALFATTGYVSDREGIGIYTEPDGTGFIVCVDQRPGESVFHVYRREGEPGRPHDHTREVARFTGGVDSTDGLDVISGPIGPGFPEGLLVAMNSTPRNFLIFDWRTITGALPALRRTPDTRGPGSR